MCTVSKRMIIPLPSTTLQWVPGTRGIAPGSINASDRAGRRRAFARVILDSGDLIALTFAELDTEGQGHISAPLQKIIAKVPVGAAWQGVWKGENTQN